MRAYAEETNRLNRERRTSGEATRRDLAGTERAIKEIVHAIEQGGFHRALLDRLTELETRQADLSARLSQAPVELPDIHPNIAEVYRRKIERLSEALGHPDDAIEAAGALREIINRIVITPGKITHGKPRDLHITLHGDLDTILDWATGTEKPCRTNRKVKPAASASRVSVSVEGRACPGHPCL
jgi:hypothetical protein